MNMLMEARSAAGSEGGRRPTGDSAKPGAVHCREGAGRRSYILDCRAGGAIPIREGCLVYGRRICLDQFA